MSAERVGADVRVAGGGVADVPRPDRRPIRSLRRRVGRSFLVGLAVYLVLTGTVFVALAVFKSKGDDAIGRWQPAYTLSVDVLTDLVNQETGVRGYALSGQVVSLQPYTRYRVKQQQDERRLHDYLSGEPDVVAKFQGLEAAAAGWRAHFAEPFIERVRNAHATVAGDVAGRQATTAFDAIRRDAADLSNAISAKRDRVQSERRTAAEIVWGFFIGTTVLVIVFGVLLWRGLRRSVLAPVEDLAVQARTVAGGSISQRITPSGPPELEALGADVDAMRARIADELAQVEAARVELQARTEDLARSNADLEQFAYVASHDLSEPLRKVANFCHLLERQYADQLDDKAKQYIDFAVDGARRMQILIADLLAFSLVGRSTAEFTGVDLDAVVVRAMANLDERLAESGAEIVRTPLPTVPGDASLLTALFQNMIGNSLKYRGPEPPRIEISARRENDHWLFTVTDNGIGIDAKYGERIFAIFQRLHLRDQYGGTGIGLALCRKIVEFHGGRIWLADPPKRGAKFQFTLADDAGPRAVGPPGE